MNAVNGKGEGEGEGGALCFGVGRRNGVVAVEGCLHSSGIPCPVVEISRQQQIILTPRQCLTVGCNHRSIAWYPR